MNHSPCDWRHKRRHLDAKLHLKSKRKQHATHIRPNSQRAVPDRMDRHRQLEPDRIFCEWLRSGQGRGPCGHHRTLVEWPDRSADHEAKAGKTPDVWTGEDRPPASPAARRNLVAQTVIEVASEPYLDANSQPLHGARQKRTLAQRFFWC